jgi:hypothetical protein
VRSVDAIEFTLDSFWAGLRQCLARQKYHSSKGLYEQDVS